MVSCCFCFLLELYSKRFGAHHVHDSLDFLSATERAPRKWSGFVAGDSRDESSSSSPAAGTSRMTKRLPIKAPNRVQHGVQRIALEQSAGPRWSKHYVKNAQMRMSPAKNAISQKQKLDIRRSSDSCKTRFDCQRPNCIRAARTCVASSSRGSICIHIELEPDRT